MRVNVDQSRRDDSAFGGNQSSRSVRRNVRRNLQNFSVLHRHVELRMKILAGVDNRAAFDQQVAALRQGRAHILWRWSSSAGGAAETRRGKQGR